MIHNGRSRKLPFDPAEAVAHLQASDAKLGALMDRVGAFTLMKKDRVGGLIFLLLGSAVFLSLIVALGNTYRKQLSDFKALYYPARCLIQHGDPYLESDVLRTYQAEGGERSSDPPLFRQLATRNPYPPTVFSFTAPLAMLSWGPAHTLWIALTVGSLIFASFLIWSLGASYAPIVSGVLIGFLLANCETVLVFVGNAAGIAVSLCAVAVWCFLRERFVPAGILCLAIGLALKPHDTGLVWLYFLLAGGIYRRRALQTLFVMVALSLPGVLWVWHVAPHWMQEMHSNILAYSVHGGINDPGPASIAAQTIDSVISLQTVFSVFRDDPRLYNPVSYLTCGPLLLIWAMKTLRSRFTQESARLALAAVSAFSMLPVYHRSHDAKLLLLTVPACAILWAEGGMMGWFALGLNTAGFVLTAEVPLAILGLLTKNLLLATPGLAGKLLTVLLARPAPLILLAMGCFYLWVYVRHAGHEAATQDHGEPEKMPLTPANA